MKKYQLPRQFSEKWVEALRSGEYEQGQGQLCNGNKKYCCLGVAGLVIGINESLLIRFAFKKLTTDIFNTPIPFNAQFSDFDLQGELMVLNDDGVSFESIALWIEQNVEFI